MHQYQPGQPEPRRDSSRQAQYVVRAQSSFLSLQLALTSLFSAACGTSRPFADFRKPRNRRKCRTRRASLPTSTSTPARPPISTQPARGLRLRATTTRSEVRCTASARNERADGCPHVVWNVEPSKPRAMTRKKFEPLHRIAHNCQGASRRSDALAPEFTDSHFHPQSDATSLSSAPTGRLSPPSRLTSTSATCSAPST